MKPPEGFTNEEYEGYTRCMSKLAVGDDVEIYLRPTNGSFVPSRLVSDHSEIVKIGARRDSVWLLVSNRPVLGFWRLAYRARDVDKCIAELETYAYAYWAYPRDVRIKRIIKAV